MNELERREWLSNLKSGDQVANEHYNSWRGGSYYQIYTVKKITKMCEKSTPLGVGWIAQR